MNLQRLKSAMQSAGPAVVGIAMGASLLASDSNELQAEADRWTEDLGGLERAEVQALAVQEAGSRQQVRQDTISETLEQERFNPEPDFIPGTGEAETIVWNQTANWIVAIDDEGEPVYMPPPDEFTQLNIEIMGSLQQRYQHFQDLWEDLEGDSIEEKIKNDHTRLVLGQIFPRKLWPAVARVIRQDGFNVPAENYPEARQRLEDKYDYSFQEGQKQKGPSFLDRALGAVGEEVKDRVQEETGLNLDFIDVGGRDR